MWWKIIKTSRSTCVVLGVGTCSIRNYSFDLKHTRLHFIPRRHILSNCKSIWLEITHFWGLIPQGNLKFGKTTFTCIDLGFYLHFYQFLNVWTISFWKISLILIKFFPKGASMNNIVRGVGDQGYSSIQLNSSSRNSKVLRIPVRVLE